MQHLKKKDYNKGNTKNSKNINKNITRMVNFFPTATESAEIAIVFMEKCPIILYHPHYYLLANAVSPSEDFLNDFS